MDGLCAECPFNRPIGGGEEEQEQPAQQEQRPPEPEPIRREDISAA